MRLNSYMPVLDAAIPVVREIVENGNVDIEVPMHKKAIGLAIDVEWLLTEFYPWFVITVKTPNGSFSYHSRRGVKKTIQMVFKESDFYEKPSEYYGDCKLVGEKFKISVGAKNTRKKIGNPFRDKLTNYLELPEERQHITLFFYFHRLSPFPVSTFYQEFEPIETFTRRTGEKGFRYPVSSVEEHICSDDVLEFFYKPLFWDSLGQYVSQGLHVIMGRKEFETTVKELSEKHKQGEERVREHLSNAINIAYEFIEAIHEEKLEDLCRKTGYGEYAGFFLKKPLKTFRKFVNPLTIDSDEVRNLTNAYNKYRKDHGKGEVSAEELLGKPFK